MGKPGKLIEIRTGFPPLNSVLVGPIDEIISKLQEIKKKSELDGFQKIRITPSRNSEDAFVIVYGTRRETPQETQSRLTATAERKRFAAKRKERIKANELRMLKRLTKKYHKEIRGE